MARAGEGSQGGPEATGSRGRQGTGRAAPVDVSARGQAALPPRSTRGSRWVATLESESSKRSRVAVAAADARPQPSSTGLSVHAGCSPISWRSGVTSCCFSSSARTATRQTSLRSRSAVLAGWLRLAAEECCKPDPRSPASLCVSRRASIDVRVGAEALRLESDRSPPRSEPHACAAGP